MLLLDDHIGIDFKCELWQKMSGNKLQKWMEKKRLSFTHLHIFMFKRKMTKKCFLGLFPKLWVVRLQSPNLHLYDHSFYHIVFFMKFLGRKTVHFPEISKSIGCLGGVCCFGKVIKNFFGHLPQDMKLIGK